MRGLQGVYASGLGRLCGTDGSLCLGPSWTREGDRGYLLSSRDGAVVSGAEMGCPSGARQEV